MNHSKKLLNPDLPDFDRSAPFLPPLDDRPV